MTARRSPLDFIINDGSATSDKQRRRRRKKKGLSKRHLKRRPSTRGTLERVMKPMLMSRPRLCG